MYNKPAAVVCRILFGRFPVHSEPIQACVFWVSPVRNDSQLHYLERIFNLLLEKEKGNTPTRVSLLVQSGAAELAFLDPCTYQLNNNHLVGRDL